LGNLSGNLTGLQNILDSFNNFVTGQGNVPKNNAFEPKVINFPSGAILTTSNRFAPVGGASVVGVRGKPLPDNAIARTRETITGSITTSAGGTRLIAGSPALFERLARNLSG